MADLEKDNPGAARQERLAAAMRENLKRRKAQARGRATSEPLAVTSEPDASRDAKAAGSR